MDLTLGGWSAKGGRRRREWRKKVISKGDELKASGYAERICDRQSLITDLLITFSCQQR